MNKIGFYAGSFCPFTRGHLGIVCEALNEYDKIIIGVGVNSKKTSSFTPEECCEMARASIDDLIFEYKYRHLIGHDFSETEIFALKRLLNARQFAEVIYYSDLTVDCALRNNASALIRGERIVGDHDAEMQASVLNKQILEVRQAKLSMATIPVPRENMTYISSTNARGLCEVGEYIAAMRYVTPTTHALMMRKYLKNRFLELIKSDYVSDVTAEDWFDKLKKAYSDKRYHHSLSHIAYCLNYLHIMQALGRIKEVSPALELAIFFHDWVNNGAADDEEASCEILKTSGFDPSLIREAIPLIMATKLTKLPENMSKEQRLMHDLDLTILGDARNYGIYAANIRREYAHVEDSVYREGRIEVLTKLLETKELFLLPYFKDMFEENARRNIKKEIAYWQNNT